MYHDPIAPKVRFPYARVDVNWAHELWQSVLASDEFQFPMDSDSSRNCLARSNDTLPCFNIIVRSRYGQVCLFRGSISLWGTTKLYVARHETMICQRCRYRSVKASSYERSDEFILKDDNIRPPQSTFSLQVSKGQYIRKWVWPARFT